MHLKISQKRMATYLEESMSFWDGVFVTIPKDDKTKLFVWTGKQHETSNGKYNFLTMPVIEKTRQLCLNTGWSIIGVTDKYPAMGLALRLSYTEEE